MGKFTEKFTQEQEEAILSLYVSKPFADIFFVYDTIPPEQFATLAAAYSRTHEPFQKRLLLSIESEDLPLPKMDSIPQDITGINVEQLKKAYSDFTENWRLPTEKNKQFIQKWAQSYGHNSIKELGNVRFICENIPDLSGKLITGHPLAHPQVKSSRYIDWKNVLAKSEDNLDLKNSKHAEEIFKSLNKIINNYQEITHKLEIFSGNHPLNQEFLDYSLRTETKKTKTQIIEAYDANARKSMLDYSRYLLTPSMLTSVGASMEVRALEEVVTDFLSSPLKQDQQIGRTIIEEAQKVVPVLMGEKSHAKISEYQQELRQYFDEALPELFEFEKNRTFEVTPRTNFVENVTSFTDIFIASAMAWHYGNASFEQYYKALTKEPKKAQEIIHQTFKTRGTFDPFPKPTLIDTPIFETLIDYGADRDNHRHRRGAWLRQALTTEHGFETPQMIKTAKLEKEYNQILNEMSTTFNNIRQDNKYVAQLIVPFAFKCRRLINWSAGQDGYYIELRSKSPGHDSYREIAWDVAEKIKTTAPTFGQYLKVDKQTYPQHLIKNARKWYDQEKRK
ncbi:FAD-dependent thymidylate synthase [Candidatus Woesearchaeota archaeon]|nr:FAD-dependent thymidylate synthase [Candidatus Woesearchaeota archaeon]